LFIKILNRNKIKTKISNNLVIKRGKIW